MGVMDKFLNYMKIGDNNDADDDGFYDDDEDFIDEPVNNAVVEDDEPIKNNDRKITKMPVKQSQSQAQPTTRKKVNMSDTSVCTFKPKAFDEAHEIVDTLLQDKIIVLNFEGVDLSISQRVLDIITGACMAIDGNLQKISNFIFIATPSSVDVSGDLQDNLTGVFDSL